MSTVRRPGIQRAYIREVSKQTTILRLQGAEGKRSNSKCSSDYAVPRLPVLWDHRGCGADDPGRDRGTGVAEEPGAVPGRGPVARGGRGHVVGGGVRAGAAGARGQVHHARVLWLFGRVGGREGVKERGRAGR